MWARSTRPTTRWPCKPRAIPTRVVARPRASGWCRAVRLSPPIPATRTRSWSRPPQTESPIGIRPSTTSRTRSGTCERPALSDHFTYALCLADTSLVLGHRLSEWSGRAPTLEEDIALANIALDLIGQARAFYAHAAQIEG